MTSVTSEPFVFSSHTAAPPTGVSDDAGADRLVDQTRREISEMVRQVAVAVRSDRTADEFFGLLADRTQCAMAAEGIVIWRLMPDSTGEQIGTECVNSLKPLRRVGRITDQSIPDSSKPAHECLLTEVAGGGRPVVVPASPGATDPDLPANPAPVPVALVPIELEPTADAPSYLIEVFLEPDCGIATQRGYLRFVAQMADLAGEFLRTDQLRRLRRRQSLAASVDQAIIALHRIDQLPSLQAAITDQTAEIFGFDRVALCQRRPATLLAVSHVETIDQHSNAAEQLRSIKVNFEVDGSFWDSSATPNDEGLCVRAVVMDHDDGKHQLVCMQAADVEPTDEAQRTELIRLMQHAEMALRNLQTKTALPGSRWLAQLVGGDKQTNQNPAKIIVVLGVLATILAAAMFPVPLVVSAPAVIRPQNVQAITASRDAIVKTIHVQHGQQVGPGDPLISLVDPELEEQITGLIGRRAVLVQQKSYWTDTLVDTASHEVDQLEKVQGESRLVAEEIESIDDQLNILRRAESALLIRARCEGIVDAWQIQQRLGSRPLRRGDWLMQVIANDSSWQAEARVPQSRISHLHQADEDQSLESTIALESDPTHIFPARLNRIGPAVSEGERLPGEPAQATAVLIDLNDDAARALTVSQPTSHQSGAPARVMFHCGIAPAGYVIFQDLIRSARSTAALYLGTGTES